MRRIIYKKMHIYRLHRSNLLDHERGRPAILLKYKSETSLVWWGTHKKENSKEVALVININDKVTFFYSKGIEKVNNIALKSVWINFKTYKSYDLTTKEQRQLISKFVEFTNQGDPFQKITLLELENQVLQKEIEVLKEEKENLLKLLQQQEFER